MDIKIANWVYETFGNSEIFANIAKYVTFLGSKWAIIAIAAILLCFKKTRKLSCYIIVACGLTYVLNDYVIKLIVKRDRPFVDISELKKISAVSMALAIIVYIFNHKIGLFAIFGSVLVGLSRIALGVHYFSDVLVGFSFGIICALIVFILNYLLSK